MKLFSLLLLLLFSLLAGCTAATSEFDAAAFRHKLDAWKPAGAAAGLAEPTRADDSASPPVRGPMLNAIVDRVMEHVDSVTANAKVSFKNGADLPDAPGAMPTARRGHADVGTDMPTRTGAQATAPDAATAGTSNKNRADPANASGATPTARLGRADAETDMPTQSRLRRAPFGSEPQSRRQSSRGHGTPPAPAPPAEELAATAGVLQDVPVGWTGAVIYSQPGCRPCEREIAAIRDSGGWTVGYGAAGFRSKAHFVVIVLTRDSEFSARGLLGTPTVVYFREGRESGKRILEYGGTDAELIAILAAHPKVNRATLPAGLGSGPAALGSSCPCATGGICTCTNGCRCGAACRCLHCPAANSAGRAAASPLNYGAIYYDPTYYDTAPTFVGSLDCGVPLGAPLVAPMDGGPSVLVPTYSSPSSYIGAAVVAPSQVGFGISAFGTPLFGASVGSCGPGGCHP